MTVKNPRIFLIALFIVAFLSATSAQVSGQSSKATPANRLADTRSELITATEAYKSSAQDVIRFQEQEIQAATKKLDELRQLVAEGLIARNDLSVAEQNLASAKAKLENTQKQIADSDNLIAQIKEAEQAEKNLAKAQALQARKLVKLTALRYHGMSDWALGNIGSVQSFFAATFGRPLPISTLGQSATHNAMGWDHRNAVDVGLHPDSVEGKALIDHLRSKGIPFLAFRGAIPGVSTGPHIHIGCPSHRLA